MLIAVAGGLPCVLGRAQQSVPEKWNLHNATVSRPFSILWHLEVPIVLQVFGMWCIGSHTFIFQGEKPVALTQHTACSQDNLMYVFGGRYTISQTNARCSFNGDLLAFEPESAQWIVVEPRVGSAFPEPRCGHSCAVVGEQMYIFGGLPAAPPPPAPPPPLRLEPPLHPPPPPRLCQPVTVHGGRPHPHGVPLQVTVQCGALSSTAAAIVQGQSGALVGFGAAPFAPFVGTMTRGGGEGEI